MLVLFCHTAEVTGTVTVFLLTEGGGCPAESSCTLRTILSAFCLSGTVPGTQMEWERADCIPALVKLGFVSRERAVDKKTHKHDNFRERRRNLEWGWRHC